MTAAHNEKKVALVTGGSTGIGKATALAFAETGAKVAVVDIVEEEGKKTVDAIKEKGGQAIFIKTDVSDAGQVKDMVDKVVDTFGGLHCAFNNAGIEGEQATTADCTVENWNRVISINLSGVWYCMKYEIPHMLEAGKGSIVNMASVAGRVGFANIPAYTASKHGVNGLTKTAALEYATRNIRVNAVCPGIIDTAMIDRFTGGEGEGKEQMEAMEPVGRMGRPEEVADAVIWLCSDKASFVTGHPLAVDGGFVAR
ncbi:SDR family oxidoreductase [candidate division KSB1 bacterium]|nr:SDR family oxidoreductase [candidate division KSB1 bacterium]